MLNDFYVRFPREVEAKLHEHMHAGGGLEKFAREDPKVRRHLDLIRRKELLETVLGKIEELHRISSGTAGTLGLRGAGDPKKRIGAPSSSGRRSFF